MTTARFVTNIRTKTQMGTALYIKAEGVPDALVPPFAPVEFRHDNIGLQWNETPRFGRTPTNRAIGKNLPNMEATFLIGYPDRRSIEPMLALFQRVAEQGTNVNVLYGPRESGLWTIEAVRWETIMRNENHEVTRASVEVVFKKVDSSSVNTPTNPTQPRPPSPAPPNPVYKPPPAPPPPPPSAPAQRRYTVRKGDTLWAISQRYYGSGTHWRRIADANGVRDPRKLQIGTVLVIP